MFERDLPPYKFARLAVDKAKLCPVDLMSKNPLPRVAVVIAKGDQLLGWFAKGHGGEIMEGTNARAIPSTNGAHAEQALLKALTQYDHDLSTTTAYVTLEPCTKRKGKDECCADLIVSAGIKEIYVGNIDPNPDIGALAWKTFLAKDIKVRDFPSDLRNEAARDNHAFLNKFRLSPYIEGGASFDYSTNGGIRILGPTGREFKTRWTECNEKIIYALDHENNVSVAKNCTNFEHVDDPGRWFEDQYYTKKVNEGDIVIFRNAYGYALVKVVNVRKGNQSTNAELKFQFQIRYFQNVEA